MADGMKSSGAPYGDGSRSVVSTTAGCADRNRFIQETGRGDYGRCAAAGFKGNLL